MVNFGQICNHLQILQIIFFSYIFLYFTRAKDHVFSFKEGYFPSWVFFFFSDHCVDSCVAVSDITLESTPHMNGLLVPIQYFLVITRLSTAQIWGDF